MNKILGSCQLGQALHLTSMPSSVVSQGGFGDGQHHVIRLVPPQNMFTGIRTQRAIRHGHHHDRERVGEQTQRRDLAIREGETQLIGRTLESYPIRTRTI